MFTRNIAQILAVGIALMAVCAGVYAQKTVYKWVDEDGVVHFSDAPPDQSKPVETDILKIPKSPPNLTPAQPATEPRADSVTTTKIESPQPETETPVLYETTDIAKMSLADLDLRCEEAREEMIAPLRQADIDKCKQDKRNDPAFCERFNRDFGDGGRTTSGTIRPRMFDDLPECVEALQERNRRGR